MKGKVSRYMHNCATCFLGYVIRNLVFSRIAIRFLDIHNAICHSDSIICKLRAVKAPFMKRNIFKSIKNFEVVKILK